MSEGSFTGGSVVVANHISKAGIRHDGANPARQAQAGSNVIGKIEMKEPQAWHLRFVFCKRRSNV
jgi:hypothetical protein